MSRSSKISIEVKLKACEDYKHGNGSYISLAKSLGIATVTLMEWYSAYSFHGSDAFNSSNRNNSYSIEYKIKIVELYNFGSYTSLQLSGKYNIAYSMVRRWINKYNSGIALKDYDPKGEVYTMKSRKTTMEERLEIVLWVISNNMNYKEAAYKYAVKYAVIYQWVLKYLKEGKEALSYKKRGPKEKTITEESPLSDIDRLKIELEREKALRKRAEFSLEVLKKKEEFEEKLRYQK
jgi:transposase-like protein